MLVKTQAGRAAQAAAIAAQTLHFAWGEGSPAWDALSEPAGPAATALTAELGRRLVVNPSFVTPDPAGDITVPSGRYRLASEPTPHLLVRVNFEFEDDATATIREIGIFVGGRPKDTVPPGQRYYELADLATPGILLAHERFPAFPRSASRREIFEYVLTF